MPYSQHLNRLVVTAIPLLKMFIGVTCKKSQPDPYNTLPAITQQGKGTFGCLVKG